LVTTIFPARVKIFGYPIWYPGAAEKFFFPLFPTAPARQGAAKQQGWFQPFFSLGGYNPAESGGG